MAKAKSVFFCQNCGAESSKWMGRCPQCGEWNTLVEEIIKETKHSRTPSRGVGNQTTKPTALPDIEISSIARVSTTFGEIDRVLGGGIVPGALMLLGGDPGIGKSTLLLQVSQKVADTVGTVLYASGEESQLQLKLRAERLHINSERLQVIADTDLDHILEQADAMTPSLLVIDSIQTMYTGDIDAAPGSVSQVRECTSRLLRFCKERNIPTVIIGHVTKEGNIAGPRMLEHMVDTVLYFEGDKHHSFRVLRSVKNRFGSTNEIGGFEMHQEGLNEVTNPSEVFLEERLAGATSSAIVVSLEGTRPILTEVQCLLSPTAFGNARRTTSGLDYNRVALLMAVLEKRAGLLLQNQDAYFKSTGGLKLGEPAVDLAIAMSIVSSYKEKETQMGDCFIGEIGLTGEIRKVNRVYDRVREAEKLGFKRVFIPKNNLDGWKIPENIEVVGVSSVKEAIYKAFNHEK